MKKALIAVMLTTVVSLAVGTQVCVAGTKCSRAIAHVDAAEQRGDHAVARLLVDFAIADHVQLGCSDELYQELLDLRRDVYWQCIIDAFDFAQDDIEFRRDGISAIEHISHANELAEIAGIKIRKEIDGIDEFYAAAYFKAALQENKAAAEAARNGDFELRDQLRALAKEFISFACALDPRYKMYCRGGKKKAEEARK